VADNINPDHYKFPGGAEVIDISEHLSANGAQVVQYVARATRQDGKVKGDVLEDLRKAQWFLAREIRRIEGPKPNIIYDVPITGGWLRDEQEYAIINGV